MDQPKNSDRKRRKITLSKSVNSSKELSRKEFYFTMNDWIDSKYEKNIEKSNLCNCSKQDSCDVNNKCKIKNVMFRCKVTSEGKEWFYIGATTPIFKKRLVNHLSSFWERNIRFQ